MSIIAFWSNEAKETGQSMSMVALSTYMAIEHNYKILNVSTNFNDTTVEDAYWDIEKTENLVKSLTANNEKVVFESGIEGLIKIINSNKTSTTIVSNYTRIVFKDRLDVLLSPKTEDYEEYQEICKFYPDIIQVANHNYDLIFVDLSKKMPKEEANKILELADVIVINITQKMKALNHLMTLREENAFFKKNNILVNVGRYDKFSKYNIKNISRYLREKKSVLAVPYNTLFFESCAEGKVADFFVRLRRVEPDDRNAIFIQEVGRMAKTLIYKLQELQMKM
ncbi:MAG: hypothetical protein ACLU84_00270 [Clostridia bacterium]